MGKVEITPVDRRSITVIKEGIVDRVVSAFSPKAGARRFATRVQEAHARKLAAGFGYVGGRYDRKSMQEWSPSPGSANDEFLEQADTLRARSRDLTRNSPIAAGASNLTTTHIVGTGLRLHSRIDGEYLGLDAEAVAEGKMERGISDWRTMPAGAGIRSR